MVLTPVGDESKKILQEIVQQYKSNSFILYSSYCAIPIILIRTLLILYFILYLTLFLNLVFEDVVRNYIFVSFKPQGYFVASSGE